MWTAVKSHIERKSLVAPSLSNELGQLNKKRKKKEEEEEEHEEEKEDKVEEEVVGGIRTPPSPSLFEGVLGGPHCHGPGKMELSFVVCAKK